MRPPSIATWLLLALVAPHAQGADAYKCVGADGSIGFQDRPCSASARQQRLRLPDVPPASPSATDAATSTAPPSAPLAQPASPAPRVPPPGFFLCTRHDGSRYRSDSGVGGTSWVPFEAIAPNRDLASVYGGRNGAGISAPGMSHPPSVGSAVGGVAYVQFDEPCHRASPQEACAYLGRELDAVQDKLKRAFSDTEAQLKRDAQALREDMRGC